ncbi:MAG TPA: VWA domain-containing protein [Pyrinomonadaceae bacterium]|nr:VWA domain-containing protein [Pyrinomonadaceae bacterium]
MRRRRFIQLFLLIMLCAVSVGDLYSQSGRNQDKTTKQRPKPGSSPSSDSERAVRVPKSTQKTDNPKSPTEVAEDEVVRVSSNLVPIPASVVDQRGIAITNLKLEDFELHVDGELKAISEMTRSDTSVRLVMLFDNSGSQHEAREFEKRAAMHFFRRVLRPADEAAVYSVESESYLAQPLTKDIGRLEQTIASFGKAEGSTSLFDAIIDAAAYLRPYSGRRVLVLVSDGIETTSRNDFETTIQRVLADDCQVFVVQTGLYDSANLRALTAERRMEQLTTQTGGAVYIPKTTTELEQAFEQIAADLAQQYVLSYYPRDERRDGRFHVIDLRVRSRRNVRVRARKGYYSPKPSNLATSG